MLCCPLQVSSHGRGSSPAKEVRQFHFLVWPDHGVPVYATALLSFRKRVFNYHQPKKGPMLVHCSAGVGRTGTFITVDCMLKRIDAEATLDIFNFVRQMRFRRNYMVQTVVRTANSSQWLNYSITCRSLYIYM